MARGAGLHAYERFSDQRAQTLSEYTIVIGVITLAVVLAVAALSTNIASWFTKIASLIV